MSEQSTGVIPEFTVSDRLRKAREFVALEQQEFADLIGVSRGTVSNYERGTTTRYRMIVLRAWAMATGVPVSWLQFGTTTSPDGGQSEPFADLIAA